MKEFTSDAGEDEVLYSAEVRHAAGKYVLTVNDHLRGNVEVYAVPQKAMKRVPLYLATLRSKLA